MSEEKSRIVMNDFSRLIDAKQMAMALMDDGVQFSFCPEPISISYPIRIQEIRETGLEGSGD